MKRKTTVYMILTALFTALIAVCSQLKIDLPFIPINLALFAVHLSGLLLGPVYGGVSVLIYLLLAAAGVPVMAGFKGGLGVLFGMTGGYAIGYLFTAVLDGIAVRHFQKRRVLLFLAMFIAVLVCYLFGTIWFIILTGNTVGYSLRYCVLPFLPGDAVKILLAEILYLRLRGPLASILQKHD